MPRTLALCAAIALVASGCPARQTQPVEPEPRPSAGLDPASAGNETIRAVGQAQP